MISKKEFEYTVGRNLAKYRKEKKLTQMQVAEMAELSVPFYASVELGTKDSVPTRCTNCPLRSALI